MSDEPRRFQLRDHVAVQWDPFGQDLTGKQGDVVGVTHSSIVGDAVTINIENIGRRSFPARCLILMSIASGSEL